MKFLQGILGFIILFYIVYTPLYLFFFNSAEDAAEKMSPISSIESLVDIASEYGGSQESAMLKQALKQVKKLADSYEDKYKVDLYTPIYKELRKNKEVTDLKLSRPLKNVPRNLYARELGDDAEIFSLDFKYGDRQYNIPIIVRKPSFLKMQTAKAFTLGAGGLLAFYGLNRQAISQFSDAFPL